MISTRPICPPIYSKEEFFEEMHRVDLRKEIERNDIPNIYINHHSSRFSWMIETAESYEEVGRVIEKMVETYAYLSRHYSMAAYSMAVKKTLLYTDSHLSEELNVNQLAALVSLTPNYLSSLFKKETGKTPVAYRKSGAQPPDR